nr:MAG TPA: hypothetical protein [Caudoviricetes sp.]
MGYGLITHFSYCERNSLRDVVPSECMKKAGGLPSVDGVQERRIIELGLFFVV